MTLWLAGLLLIFVGSTLSAETPNEAAMRRDLADARAQLVRAVESAAARNAEDARTAAAAAVLVAAANAERARQSTSWMSLVAAVLPVVAFVGGLVWWAIKTTMRNEMSRANAVQLQQINGTYVRAQGASVTGAELQRILSEIREELGKLRAAGTELHEYTHHAIHELRNAQAVIEAGRLLREAH